MNNKFLNKSCDQIVSETRIIDNKLHTPFLSNFPLPPYYITLLLTFSSFSPFSSHCKDIYCLNKEETDYIWDKYKKEVVSIINNKKELTYE